MTISVGSFTSKWKIHTAEYKDRVKLNLKFSKKKHHPEIGGEYYSSIPAISIQPNVNELRQRFTK